MDLNQDFPIKSETLNLRVLFSKRKKKVNLSPGSRLRYLSLVGP